MKNFQYLSEIYAAANEAKKTRTFCSTMRDLGFEWFSARGIEQEFHVSIYAWTDPSGDMDYHFETMPNVDVNYMANILIDNCELEGTWRTEEGAVYDVYEQPAEQEEEIKTETKPEKMQTETPKKEVTAEKKEAKASFSLQLDLEDMIAAMVNKNFQESIGDIKTAIQKEVDKLTPTVISINNKQMGKVTGTQHALLPRVLKKLITLKQVYLCGPTGSGKTHLSEQVAQGLDLEFSVMSVTAGMAEGHLLGRQLLSGEYVSSKFVQLYENGGVFLLDEVDSADANTLLSLNSALANGYLSIPTRTENPIAYRHEDFYLIAAGNTWGRGSFEYAGREQQDLAFLNRFDAAKFYVDYDEKLELHITKDQPKIAEKFHQIRRALEGTQRVVSTRTIINAYKCVMNGEKLNDVIEDFIVDFTEAERNKVLKA